MFTQNELHEMFNYSPDTGILVWKAKFPRRKIGDAVGYVFRNHGGKKYLRVRINNRQYLVHRIIYTFIHGKILHEIDHIDGDGMNNKKSNLRDVQHKENQKNKRLYSKNVTGVHNVSIDHRNGHYRSAIAVNHKRFRLGSFVEIWDAICAKKSAENKHGFHINHGEKRPL